MIELKKCPICNEKPIIKKNYFTKTIHCPYYHNVIRNINNCEFGYTKNQLITNDNNATVEDLVKCWNDSIL